MNVKCLFNVYISNKKAYLLYNIVLFTILKSLCKHEADEKNAIIIYSYFCWNTTITTDKNQQAD